MTATLIIIALTCAASFVALNNPKMLQALVLWPPAVKRDNDWYRLVTYGLVHADLQHLLFNMITLYFFGRVMEDFYNQSMGQFGFAFFYTLGLIVSILPSYLKNRDNSQYHSLGASGAVSAVLFAYILFEPWKMILVFFLPVPAIVYAVLYVVYSIWSGRQGKDNVNHSAHLWGAAYGVIFTLVLDPRVSGLFLDALLHPDFG